MSRNIDRTKYVTFSVTPFNNIIIQVHNCSVKTKSAQYLSYWYLDLVLEPHLTWNAHYISSK